MSASRRNKAQKAAAARANSPTTELSPVIDMSRPPAELVSRPARKTKGQASDAVAAEVVVEATPSTPAARKPSIRGTINAMLAEGKSTAEIAARVQELFPTSQAAAKSTKHISFYRCLANKERKLASKPE